MNEAVKILIVEDSLVQAAYLQYILEQHSYHVLVTRDGKEALATMEKHRPSIVISDIIMPGIDGYELCRRMRADESLKHIPVIILTQLSSPEDVIRGLECGANNFVTKPYREEYLLSRIQDTLANQELRKSVATEEGIEILFADRKYSITSDRMQILDLLLSTYEVAIQKNRELEQANEELQEAIETIRALEANHRMLLESNADAIIVVDQGGIVRFVNPAAEVLFGRKAEELLGESFEFPLLAGETTEVSITHSVGGTALGSAKPESRKAGRPVVRPSGFGDPTSERTRVAEMRVVETNWEGENAYLASLRDMTERKRAEEALRESEEKYKTLTNNLNVGVYRNTPGPRGRFIEMNPAHVEMFGYESREEFLAVDVADLYLNATDREKFSDKLSNAGFAREELQLRKKDGTPLIGLVSAVAVRDENGEVMYFDGIIEDITERKRMEEALQESLKREAQAYAQGRLEIVDTMLHNIGNAINSVTIGVGTIQEDLANSKLTRHFLSLANALKEHQDDFSDYVKSDLQGQKVAPFIIALANDLAEHDEELAKTVSRVRERAEHIADIIRTEKVLSRRSIYSKEIDLREAINNAVTVLQDSISKRGIEIGIDCGNIPKEISTQGSQFHQMLVNLIKNSIEAIDDLRASESQADECEEKTLSPHTWRPEIRVKCYAESNLLILEVSDNGIGIEKDKLDVIFRSGYTTKESGSGLGLHSIANFVKGCNGQIQALSDGIGKGATMRVVLTLPSAAS